jgi:uncharacterized RDD family membrane protein YckC
MSEGYSGTSRLSFDAKPHAYDPAASPELFEDVLPRRVVAFLIDLVIIAIPIVILWFFIFAIGIVTLGLGFILYALMPVVSVIWALVYYGTTFASPRSATIGMRVMDLEMRTRDGAPCYFALGAMHAVAFWISVSTLSPLILLVAFFNDRRRLLHDMFPAIALLALLLTFFGLTLAVIVIALLLLAFSSGPSRLMQDLLGGTVVVNNDLRARMLRAARESR